MKCNYCGEPVELVIGEDIYPHLKYLHKRWYWKCTNCNAYVGTHINSKSHKPLGILANARLRRARMDAHIAIDAMWKGKDNTSRTDVYYWLADKLGLHITNCHIGQFRFKRCNKVVKIVEESEFKINYKKKEN